MPRLRFLPAVLALAACAPAAPPVESGGPRVERVLTSLRPGVRVAGAPEATFRLADRLARFRVPGISVAIADSGRIRYAFGAGIADAGSGDSVTPDTRFQAASISKPVAATVMLRLVEEGRLALDEDVNRYLTSWRVPENGFTATEKVTLRRLASHSAGLTVHGFPGYAVTDSIPSVPRILDGERPANTAAVRVDTTPGDLFRYSGGGTTVMQLVLSDVTGTPFPELARRLVLEPAGMLHSTYEQPPPPPVAARTAAAHGQDGAPVAGRWHVYPELAAAGLWTTPTDLLRWAIAIADARAGRPGALLSPETAREMLTVQKGTVGLGPFLNGADSAFSFGHGGANRGFRSQLIYFPETGQGAAVMANADNGGTVIQEILYAIAAEFGWPGYGPTEVTALALDGAALVPYAGTYAASQPVPVRVEITLEDGRLFLEVPGFEARGPLVLTSPTEGVSVESGTRFRFEIDAAGRVRSVGAGGIRAVRTP